MIIEEAYLIGNHPASFREGECARIIGAKIVQPDDKPASLCFEVLYGDGRIHFVEVEDYNRDVYVLTTGKSAAM